MLYVCLLSVLGVLRQTTVLDQNSKTCLLVSMKALCWHDVGAEPQQSAQGEPIKKGFNSFQKVLQLILENTCPNKTNLPPGIGQILKTLPQTPNDLTCLNTISANVYVVWKKDFLQSWH